MRSIRFLIIVLVICGVGFLVACKVHTQQQNSQPASAPVVEVRAVPSASTPQPAAAASPAPPTTGEPAAVAVDAKTKPASATAGKPAPAAPSSAVMMATPAAGGVDGFAQCLTQKQVSMYGHALCPHCAEQKATFGEAFKYVHYVECGVPGQPMTVQNQECKDMQIKRYPTWVFPDGERVEGPQTFEKLGQKAGCKAP
jgi:hypothetical protein